MSPAYWGVRLSCSKKKTKNTHLQTVVADQAEQRDDGVEHGQEAQSRQHVAGALLQDELVHVEERVLVVLLIATPAVLTVFLFVTLARDLNSDGILRFTPQASQDRHSIIYLQMHLSLQEPHPELTSLQHASVQLLPWLNTFFPTSASLVSSLVQNVIFLSKKKTKLWDTPWQRYSEKTVSNRLI